MTPREYSSLMKHEEARLFRQQQARLTLGDLRAEVGQDFYSLDAWQVERLLDYADLRRYRKPKNANGSRGRYFYAKLQREAQ